VCVLCRSSLFSAQRLHPLLQTLALVLGDIAAAVLGECTIARLAPATLPLIKPQLFLCKAMLLLLLPWQEVCDSPPGEHASDPATIGVQARLTHQQGGCACDSAFQTATRTPRDEQHTRDTTARSLPLLLSRHEPCQVILLLRTPLLGKECVLLLITGRYIYEPHSGRHCAAHTPACVQLGLHRRKTKDTLVLQNWVRGHPPSAHTGLSALFCGVCARRTQVHE
jgi:hypothetical protein